MAALLDRKNNRTIPIAGKVTLIGRDPACDIVVPTPTTSSRHAIILNTGDNYAIEDLGSLGGTLVNGKKVVKRTPLEHGDHIDLPGLSVKIELAGAVGSSTGRDTLTMKALPKVDPSRILSSIEIGNDTRLGVKPEAKLRAVLEIVRSLGTSLDLRVVLPKTLESLFAIFPHADCGFILLVDDATGQLVPKAVKYRHDPENQTVSISRGIVEHVLESGLAVLSADAGSDTRFNPTHSIQSLNIRSFICAPLVGQDGKSFGVVQIDSRSFQHQFHPDDLDLLACASVLAARTVELARMNEERREMEAATRIQKSFLPAQRPPHPKLSFYDHYSPAQQVGGDYFDYIPLPDGRIAMAIGDVSGKGISAALLMARVSAAVRFTLATAPTVAQAVRELNRALLRTGSEERFVTFVVVVIDVEQSRITMANAGHIPPLLKRRGQDAREIGDEVVGLPLAVMDRSYEEVSFVIEPGDTLLLCTDGVTEARNTDHEMYGRERLRDAVQAAPDDIEAVGTAVLNDVRRFAGKRPQNDDLTIVGFGWRTDPIPGEK